ncbi:MAG: IS21 family transposase [Kiritimatiellaceae bacterium]|nr:IS21 family transposase [Kiritimatiellaceae bacterium]
MHWWTDIRRRVLVENVSKRQIMRETGIHWKTLEKILSNPQPPGYCLSQPRPQPKIGPFRGSIEEILKQDRDVPRKQRHTVKRIFERLREEGYAGGYTQVKGVVRDMKGRLKEVYIPLSHRPGEAQMDFGYALVNERGVTRKVAFFVMSLPYSDAVYVQVFERICTEVFWEGHMRAFAFFEGVPCRISYDNERVMVAKVLLNHARKLTTGFLQLQSHYLFGEHFCNVRRGNEKGVVESMVRYTRSNFMVPVPQVRSLEELNRILEEQCRNELGRKLRGKDRTKGELLEEERSHFHPLPDEPFEACRKRSTTASSLSLVRFDRNDYSVPVRFAHCPVVIKGYIDRVEVCRFDERIANHPRLWTKEGVQFDPIHYLALLERKPGGLDYARPLEDWKLPHCFTVLRRRLETERNGDGTREYIRVLRLLEKHSLKELTHAVEQGLRSNALIRDAIAQFLIRSIEWRHTRFELDGRDHLRLVKVDEVHVSDYNRLLGQEVGV